jgi:acetylornithine deacetylase/succinyl-diaminopimelate desuccinylase-like protein
MPNEIKSPADEQARFEHDLGQLVGIPTVSADPAHRADIKRCAALAVELLAEAGFKAKAVPTSGNPLVFGRLVQDPSFPTITLYNHLDVQPADPSEWRTDPFALTIEAGRYYGRGATDDKGPALAALLAVRRAVSAGVPLNFTVLWESEEEIGSPHFEEFVRAHRAELDTNVVVVSDTEWIAAGRPAIPYGLRGLVTFEVSLRTARNETHSGSVGGATRNPLGELAGIIAECYDPSTGRVLIPGFYDAVSWPTESELDSFVASGFTLEHFKRAYGLTSLRSEDPRTLLSRIMAEPTFEVHGIAGGYTGPGVKTSIPPAATAKLSCRLVPSQDPVAIFELIKKFIRARHPDAQVSLEASAQPYLGDPSGPYLRAAAAAVEGAFGKPPVFIREGGTIGAVLTMSQYLRAPIVMVGLSLPEHGYHAPGEHFDWDQARGGIDLFARYFKQVAQMPEIST